MAESPMAQSLALAVQNLGWDLIIHAYTNGLPSPGVIVSPYSIAVMLAMLAGGAENEHRKQLCAKLGLQFPDNLAFAAKLPELLRIKREPGMLTVACALFADQTFSIHGRYTLFLEAFSAQVATLPSLSAATDDINKWIASETNELITNLLDRSTLEGAQFLLLSAIAFQGKWTEPFDARNTRAGYPFRGTKEAKTVDMMCRNNERVLVSQKDRYNAIRLEYKHNSPPMSFSTTERPPRPTFIAYLPHESATLQDVLPDIRRDGVPTDFRAIDLAKLGLPRFTVTSDMELTRLLPQLGYPLQGGYPDIGVGGDPTQEQLMIHSAIVKVDEEGTVAAAVTATVGFGSAPSSKPSLIFDRPFAFSIVEDTSRMILFTGVFTG